MKQTSLTHKLLVFLLCMLVTLAAFSQDKKYTSQNQQYIVLDTLQDSRPPLHQRYYNYRRLVRMGYKPVPYKGAKCMTWKWYLELYNRTETKDCCYNICIGRQAGFYLRNEKYCVIVGSDSASTNVYGRDMIWQVDFEHPILSKEQKKELKLYYKKWVVAGKDNIKSRIELFKRFNRIKN